MDNKKRKQHFINNKFLETGVENTTPLQENYVAIYNLASWFWFVMKNKKKDYAQVNRLDEDLQEHVMKLKDTFLAIL